MIVAIIVGGAILIGAFLVFGPVGLVIALVGALLWGWLGSWTTISEKDKAHAKAVDEALGFKHKDSK